MIQGTVGGYQVNDWMESIKELTRMNHVTLIIKAGAETVGADSYSNTPSIFPETITFEKMRNEL